MASLKFYLDTRRSSGGDNPSPIMIVIQHRNTSSMIYTGISVYPEEWKRNKIVGSKPKQKAVENFYFSLYNCINDLSVSGRLRCMTAKDIKEEFVADTKQIVKVDKKKLFEARYEAYMNRKDRKKTYSIYEQTLKKLRRFCPKLAALTFDDITKDWILDFEAWAKKSGHKDSTIAIDLRNIRAVFNDAIDDEVTAKYPFRRIKIRQAATKDRSMSKDELLQLFSAPVPEWQQEYVDMFKLMFCLCGINIGDLSKLDRIRAGRIEYDRQKTGKHYSIKVEPEAMEIIRKYEGDGQLLSILDRYKDYSDYNHHLNDALKKVGMVWENGKKYTGKALFPEISSYYARYSWATIAAELDIPKETIAAGLGHSQNDVTAIYIRNDMRKKVDAANRKVLDYVFGK